jgi:DNA polymerase III epsilon subunit-like protein
MYLFFDVETTGLPQNYDAPITNIENWPRVIQFAWLQCDANGKKLSEKSYIIKPVGFMIPSASTKIHNITTKRALKEGVAIEKVLKEFLKATTKSKIVIGHNVDFDYKVVSAECIRANITHNLSKITRFCTMKSSTNYCGIRNSNGFKWPTQQELHTKLFKKSYEEAHNASTDVTVCAKCFFELKKLNIIKV